MQIRNYELLSAVIDTSDVARAFGFSWAADEVELVRNLVAHGKGGEVKEETGEWSG